MISETLQSTHLETSNVPVSHEFTFSPQKHEYIIREDEVYIKFYGPMSSGMEYFIEREEEHEKRITELEKTFREKALLIRGYSAESIEPHYFLPMITTASAEDPASAAEVDPIE